MQWIENSFKTFALHFANPLPLPSLIMGISFFIYKFSGTELGRKISVLCVCDYMTLMRK